MRKTEKTKKNKKKHFAWTYPRFFSQNCFFCFFWFSSSFWTSGLGRAKNLEKNQKKQKKTILHGLTQDSSHRIVFFVFFGFLRVFGQVGLGEQKSLRKTKKTKKKQFCMDLPKILLTGLFWKAGNGKKGKKQNMQKPNAPSVCFCFFLIFCLPCFCENMSWKKQQSSWLPVNYFLKNQPT